MLLFLSGYLVFSKPESAISTVKPTVGVSIMEKVDSANDRVPELLIRAWAGQKPFPLS